MTAEETFTLEPGMVLERRQPETTGPYLRKIRLVGPLRFKFDWAYQDEGGALRSANVDWILHRYRPVPPKRKLPPLESQFARITDTKEGQLYEWSTGRFRQNLGPITGPAGREVVAIIEYVPRYVEIAEGWEES